MRRRDFLGLGALAGASYALSPFAGAGTNPRRPGKRAILVFITGGWDTCYALDPKEPSHVVIPDGHVQRFGELDVFVDASRPEVTRYFEAHADLTAIIRGIGTDAINHNECQRRIATGTREETNPDFGAIIAHELGDQLPLPYLIFGDTAWTGPFSASAGRIGASNQIVELLDRSPRTGDRRDALSDHEQALVDAYANASLARARATRGSTGYNQRRIADFEKSIERSRLLERLGPKLGKRGTLPSMIAQSDLALDALERDVSQAVMLSTVCAWDTHADNFNQGPFHEIAFGGLSHLVDELIRRPGRVAGTKMIDDTAVIVFSELGRTAQLNGVEGKEHWPVTSAMVIGAGVRGGRVFGATTPDCLAVPIDLATGAPDAAGMKPLYNHFVAGVLALCGVDPADYLDAKVMDAFAV